jgi:hypothetical protein
VEFAAEATIRVVVAARGPSVITLRVLHKAGAGTNDNWAVGWLQDTTGTNTTPAGIVPGYLLGRYFPLPPSFIPGTLYAANMVAQGGAASSGVGNRHASTQRRRNLGGPVLSRHWSCPSSSYRETYPLRILI